MAIQGNVYLFVHLIFLVNEKKPLLSKPVRKILEPFLKKSADEKGILIEEIGGTENHLHFFIHLSATQNLSLVVKTLKQDSQQWINDTQLVKEEFGWQNDFLAYSVSPNTRKQSINYIRNQEEYHKTKSLEEEMSMLSKIVSTD